QELSRRGGRALRFRRRRRGDRFHLVREPAVLRRLPPRAAIGGRQALHVPLRRERHGPARAAARRRERRGACRSAAERLAGEGGPLQRAARRAEEDARTRSRRDVQDGRLMLTHVDENDRPTMVDVGDKDVTRRTAEARAIVEFPAAAGIKAGEALRTKKGPVFDTAIIAGVMA